METKEKIQSTKCNSGALRLLGDFWTLSIINALAGKEMRFCELQRSLGNLNPVTLTDRLKKLTEASLVERKEETQDKLSVSYLLSEKGVGILPVLREIETFSEKYL